LIFAQRIKHSANLRVDDIPKSRKTPFIKHRSISIELAVGLVLLIFLVEGCCFSLSIIGRPMMLYRQMETKADEYAVNLSETLAVPMWDYDDEQIRRIGAGFARNEFDCRHRSYHAMSMARFTFNSTGMRGNIKLNASCDVDHIGQPIGQASFSLSLDAYRRDLNWLRNTSVFSFWLFPWW
jgi:hypothetical protein